MNLRIVMEALTQSRDKSTRKRAYLQAREFSPELLSTNHPICEHAETRSDGTHA